MPISSQGRYRVIAVLLALLILLPALFYAGFELSSYTAHEEIMQDVYRRQLDAILFSVNQYSWDVASQWGTLLTEFWGGGKVEGSVHQRLSMFLERTPGIESVVIVDTTLVVRGAASRDSAGGRTNASLQLLPALQEKSVQLAQLVSLGRRDYRKIEPVLIGDSGSTSQKLALVFFVGQQATQPAFLCMVVDEQAFIDRIIQPKLADLASGDFVLAVLTTIDKRVVLSTSEISEGAQLQTKSLWLFPQFEVGISPRGTNIEEIVRTRLTRNLVLVLMLSGLLFLGGWFVFRTIRAEVDLARARSRLVSNVSHELRTPLSLIRMYAETLAMGRLRDEAKRQEYYATIVRETERLTHLVNNILDFSRMEAGSKRYDFKREDLNALVRGVLETYHQILQSKGFTPAGEFAEDLPAISADRQSIQEAVINLLDNALKYSPGEKFLSIRTWKAHDRVVLEIRDHGIGISPSHQRKIFDAFYRVADPLVQETRGSGIGLSLVKQIAEAHGGTVQCESEPGKGSAFRLVLPILHGEGADGRQNSVGRNQES